MQSEITTNYVVCDDNLKAVNHRDDPQAGLITAEVLPEGLWLGLFSLLAHVH